MLSMAMLSDTIYVSLIGMFIGLQLEATYVMVSLMCT